MTNRVRRALNRSSLSHRERCNYSSRDTLPLISCRPSMTGRSRPKDTRYTSGVHQQRMPLSCSWRGYSRNLPRLTLSSHLVSNCPPLYSNPSCLSLTNAYLFPLYIARVHVGACVLVCVCVCVWYVYLYICKSGQVVDVLCVQISILVDNDNLDLLGLIKNRTTQTTLARVGCSLISWTLSWIIENSILILFVTLCDTL